MMMATMLPLSSPRRASALLSSLPFLLSLLSRCLCDQHVLLDTTKESMLDWRRYPYGPQAPTPGWVEESFTNFEKGINWRSYVVCDVGYPNVNNWLWTPSITKHDANRIYIEVKFSLRNCDLFPGTALQCKETFSLLYHEFDAAAREPDPWEPESFKQIDVIAADEGRFTNNNEVIINTETRSVEVTKKGVYFAFRDQGACLSLLAVKVYYLKCPEITVGFARYPETATGGQITSIAKVPGQCVANAVAVQQPHNLCKADGTWSFHSGLCSCMAGYEPNDGTATQERGCAPCPIGKFKHEAGNRECRICPAHSQALYAGSVECRCAQGYFRPPDKDSKGLACTRPPQSPRDLRSRFLNATSVRLTWGSPSVIDADDRDLRYRVTCDVCPSVGTTYDPSHSVLPAVGGVIVSGLEEGAFYVFQVSAVGSVSDQLDAQERKESTATILVDLSQSSPSASSGHRVRRVRLVEIKPTAVSLAWSPPSSSSLSSSIIDVYEVRYYERMDGAGSNGTSATVITKRDNVEIKNLKRNTEYAFQVRAQTASRGWGPFSHPPVYATTGGRIDADTVYVGDRSGANGGQVTVGVVVSALVVLVLCIVIFLLLRRSGIILGGNKKDRDNDSIDYRGIDNTFPTETLPIVQTAHGGQAGGAHGTLANTLHGGHHPVYNPFSLHKTYVDPHTYEDPNAAVRQFAKEIDPKYITIEAIIGGGEFGDVCRGRLSMPDRNDMLVAIKTLKSGSSDKAKIDFLTEASIMGQFEHPNVIFLQGVVTKANPIMIITEYMENGSLDTFLRANDGKFQVMQLVGMMRGIAYGMQYLAEMNYVHRDLAARNVLVNSQLVCKIADFGLSREVSPDPSGAHGGTGGVVDGAYTTRGGKIPVRWTAPEAIAFRKFTSASDVWSFGIVMWEVMSYGERPYWTWSNQDVIKAIEKGYRLPAPMDCPEAIHQLMLDSWQRERAHRPTFASIVKTLDKLICCPETLRKIAASPAHYGNPYSGADGAGTGAGASAHPAPEAFASVDEWLTSIKMQRYSESFAAAGVVEMDQVVKLSLQQLTSELGVTLVGHQKKIMSSIQAMRAHLAVNMSEGFLV